MDPIVLIGLVVVLGGVAVWYFNRDSKSLDVNNDGAFDSKDVKQAVATTVEGVKAVVDVNKDGKVDVADVKEVASKVKKTAKKAAVKAKTTAKKATTKSPKLKVAK
jgi:hypothetical protein